MADPATYVPIKALEIPVVVLNADGSSPLEGIKFASDNIEMDVNDADGVELVVTPVPATATLPELTYTLVDANEVSYTSYFTIKDGVIKLTAPSYYWSGVKNNPLTLTATSKTDATIKASTTFTVVAIAPTSINLGVTEMELSIGDEYTMQYEVLPANASDKSLYWSVKEGDAVTVDQNGKVKAVKAGEATIIVYSMSGDLTSEVAATCKFVVNKLPAASISFAEADLKKTFVFGKDTELQLAPVFKEGEDPAKYDQTVKYEVVEGAIPTAVKVDPVTHKLTVQQYNSTWVDGENKDVNNTYKVRATLVSNPTKTAEFTVVVKLYAPTAINFSSPLVGMNVGGVFTPTVTYTPADALGVDGDFTLATSDATVVAVEGTSLKALKAGKVTVTVTAPQTYNYGDLKVQPLYPFGAPVSTTFEVEVTAPAE